MNPTHLKVILTSSIITFIILQIKLSYIKTIDKPSLRSSHKKETLTSGGISFSLGSIFSSIFLGNYQILTLVPLIITGYIDDKSNLSRKTRYLVQIITSVLILYLGNSNIYNLSYFSQFLLTILWIIFSTALINFINFMDGIDGLVTTNLIFLLFASYTYSAHNYIFIIFYLIIFLKWNWEPAKIFMGDVGSTFLGGLILLLLIEQFSIQKSFFILSICSPLLWDSLLTLITRFFRRENIFKPHKEHLYQKLNQKGLSHKVITFFYLSMSLVMFTLYRSFNFYGLVLGLIIQLLIWFSVNKNFLRN